MSDPESTPRSYLLFAAYDSMNQPMAALVPALRARGCTVRVVTASLRDEANLYAFSGCDAEIIEAGDCTDEMLDETDVVVMPPVRMLGLGTLFKRIRARGILIVSFATLFSSVVMREYPDLLLCLGEAKFDELECNGLRYNMVAVGNPQYDGIVEAGPMRERGHIERVLVIDQGGYPFGARGKAELARTLECIARFNQEMEFHIKPRFYPQLKGRMTHTQAESLIDFIEDPPANLGCLTEPSRLEDIICDYDAVITSWSTAYLDAALRGMPLILISGFDSTDVFDVRLQRVAEAFCHLEATGCVHDYHELQEKRVGFQQVDPAYLAGEVYDYGTPCSERAIHAIELAYEQHTVRGRQWKAPFALGYDEFAATVEQIPSEDRASEHARTRHAYLVAFNTWMQERVYVNRCMACPFDMSEFGRYYELSFEQRPEPTESFETAYAGILQQARQRWAMLNRAYFSDPRTLEQVEHDAILQDYYFDWLFTAGRYEVLDTYEGPLLAPSSLAYNRARAMLVRDDPKKAFQYLQEFLDDVVTPRVHVISKDRRALRLMGPFFAKRHLGRFARFVLVHGNFRKLLELARRCLAEDSLTALASRAVALLREVSAGGCGDVKALEGKRENGAGSDSRGQDSSSSTRSGATFTRPPDNPSASSNPVLS